MELPENIINQLTPDQVKLVAMASVGLICSSVVFIFAQVVRFAIGMKNDINHMKTNCLPTIQNNTGKTADLLEDLVKEISEMNGYLKGKLD